METRQVILQLRTAKGLSQEELAAKVYVTRQAVSRWETGETVPNTETLKLLSQLAVGRIAAGAGIVPCQCQRAGKHIHRHEYRQRCCHPRTDMAAHLFSSASAPAGSRSASTSPPQCPRKSSTAG